MALKFAGFRFVFHASVEDWRGYLSGSASTRAVTNSMKSFFFLLDPACVGASCAPVPRFGDFLSYKPGSLGYSIAQAAAGTARRCPSCRWCWLNVGNVGCRRRMQTLATELGKVHSHHGGTVDCRWEANWPDWRWPANNWVAYRAKPLTGPQRLNCCTMRPGTDDIQMGTLYVGINQRHGKYGCLRHSILVT